MRHSPARAGKPEKRRFCSVGGQGGVSSDGGRGNMAALGSDASWQRPHLKTINGKKMMHASG